MNQFGDERRQTLSGEYSPEQSGLMTQLVREFRPVVLSVSYWLCFRPWNVPVRRICDNFFLFVEQGEEVVTVDGERRVLRRGDGIVVPEFTAHSFGLAKNCDSSSHFIAHALAENATAQNPFAGFESPFLRLRDSDSALRELKRIAILRETAPDAAANRMSSWILERILDEVESGRYHSASDLNCDERIRAALCFIRNNFRSNIGVADLAECATLREVRFRTLFTRSVGLSPAAYLLRYRLIHAARELARYDRTIKQTASDSGFSSEAYFCTAFRKMFLCTPAAYRKNSRTC